jgi:predicted ATPase
MIDFSSLELRHWRQFSDINLDLTRQVTVLTGQNGCGKTTLLNILNRHFGWSINFVSTPYTLKKSAKRIWSDIYRPRSTSFSFDDEPQLSLLDQRQNIGKIGYSNGASCNIFVNGVATAQYAPDYDSMQTVVGMHIPSHRPLATYTDVKSIPTDPKGANEEYQQYQQLLMQYSSGAGRSNPGTIQKQSLISFAVFGEGNNSVIGNSDLQELFLTFQEVLRKVLPSFLGFERIEIRMPEVVLVTSSGTFSLDAMSGGINAIFSIAWQVHMYGVGKTSFTITIDEPENHLHPSIQRSLLPNLAEAFPKAKFIISTHSPFIVSSFPEATIYALVKDEASRVKSLRLDLADVSGTPNEVLREVLDVGSNLPLWVEKKLDDIFQRVEELPEAERAKSIMEELGRLGIADSIVEYKRHPE